MPAIFFSNLWMLAGLAALSIPVLIHLLLRRKKKKARFSTLQFFVRQDEQASQRRKLRHWLLLSLRLLICALLVFAFARPYLQNPLAAAGAQRPRRALILLDRTLSMQAVVQGASKWSRAKESVQQVLSELQPNDRAALIGCGARAEVLSEWAPGAALAKLLADLAPSDGTSSLADGLQSAKRLLNVMPPEATATLYLVSDGQRNGAENLGTYPLPSDIDLKVIPVGDLMTPNLAILDLQVEPKNGVSPHAVIASFSDEDHLTDTLEMTVDGKVISSGPLALSAGAITNVDLAIPSMGPGWHQVAVRLQTKDALGRDDARFQTVFVPQPARVWVVETRLNEPSFDQESFFLTTGLDPGREGTNAVQSGFTCEKMSADEVLARLAGGRTNPLCDVIVLPGLKQIPAGLAAQLNIYVEKGGGLLLFVNDSVSANRYNTEFRTLLPAQLGSAESKADLDSGWRIAAYDTNSAAFAAFQLPNSGNLGLARFVKRFELTVPDSRTVLAQFDDGHPFLTAMQRGSGQVILANTSADTGWNDWPKHKSFVPWLHGTGYQLARLASRDRIQAQTSLIAATDNDLEFGAAAANQTYQIVAAGEKPRAITADATGALRDIAFTHPGIYSFQSAAGVEARRVAVNVPPSESDLTAFAAKELQQQIARTAEARPTTLAAGLFSGLDNRHEFWRLLLLSVLVLLFAELFVANRTHA